MPLLAIDTSLQACSVALADANGHILSSAYKKMARGHAEVLGEMCQAVMSDANHAFKDLKAVAVTRGPGTFTGVRVGLSMARGLGVALNIPVLGFSSLEAIALNVTEPTLPIIVAIDARRDQVYLQGFSKDCAPVDPARAVTLSEIAQHLPAENFHVLGSGAEMVLDASKFAKPANGEHLPDAARIASFSAKNFISGAIQANDYPADPLYLRAADAKAQKPLIQHAAENTEIVEVGLEASIELAEIHKTCFEKNWSAEEIATLLLNKACAAHLSQEGNGFVMTQRAADEAEILTLAVLPEARRRKIGSALVHKTCETLRRQNINQLHLEVGVENKSAIALYKNCGFAEKGVRKDYYKHEDGTREDALILTKILS